MYRYFQRGTIAPSTTAAKHFANLPAKRPQVKPHPTLHRIKFSNVPVGQRFYDPISEYFVKQSATTAAMVTGAGDGAAPDEFELDDVVGTEES